MNQSLQAGLRIYARIRGHKAAEDKWKDIKNSGSMFDRYTIEYLYGQIWTRDQLLAPHTRSLINVAMLAALGRTEEFKSHLRGALHQNAIVSPEQLEELMLHVAHYAGWPAGNSGVEAGRQVFAELAAEKTQNSTRQWGGRPSDR